MAGAIQPLNVAESTPTNQAMPSQDAARQRTWFLQGMGLAALMLVGVYSMGGLKFQHESPSGSENPSGYGAGLAYSPVLAGASTRGRSFHSSVGKGPAVASLPQPRTGTRDISMAAGRYTPLLGKLGEKQFVTGLAESGLLSGAEKAGLLSKLEKAGIFSTIEKSLPLAEKLGAPQFLQGAIDNPGGLGAQGAALVALGPIYAALVAQGVVPDPGELVLIPGVVLTATTAVGAAFVGLSNQLGQISSGESSFVESELPLVGRLGDASLSFLSKQKLLSKAEDAGVFSTLEESGALSLAENALPTIDKLGLLQFLQEAIDGQKFTTGAALLVLGPTYAVLVSQLGLPDVPVLPAILFTGTTVAGLATLAVAPLVASIGKKPDDGGRQYREYLAEIQAGEA
jgi:hypothetical protein